MEEESEVEEVWEETEVEVIDRTERKLEVCN